MSEKPYFDALSQALSDAGRFQPSIVIDRDRLDANIALVRAGLYPGRALRLVDKSLPSLPLISRLMQGLGTRLIMTFHLPITRAVLSAFPDVRLLFGKPMPVAGLAHVLNQADAQLRLAFSERVTLLVDSMERLAAYSALAAQLDLPLRFAAEIDIGMHRGGFADPGALSAALATIAADPLLKCDGVMGYEAHIPKIPGFAGGAIGERRRVLARYDDFVSVLGADQRRIVNIGGSNTALGYDGDCAANEMSMGSGFVLPTDFDGGDLTSLKPAVFIATPALKIVDAQLPGPSLVTSALQAIGKFPRKGCFIYGGKWMARPVHPQGMVESALWGHSSNQQFMALPENSDLRQDELVFFRPTQSEAALQQFGAIAVYSNGKIVEEWQPMPLG